LCSGARACRIPSFRSRHEHMTMGLALTPAPIATLVLASMALLVVATVLAVRARAASQSFGWIVVAGAAYAVLGMAAALHVRESDGVRASVLQLLAVVLASAVAMLCSTTSEGEKGSGGRLATAGRVLAWLTLVGLPPTLGFHSKVMVYRSLLMADWGWVAVVAILASAAALLPAVALLTSALAAGCDALPWFSPRWTSPPPVKSIP